MLIVADNIYFFFHDEEIWSQGVHVVLSFSTNRYFGQAKTKHGKNQPPLVKSNYIAHAAGCLLHFFYRNGCNGLNNCFLKIFTESLESYRLKYYGIFPINLFLQFNDRFTPFRTTCLSSKHLSVFQVVLAHKKLPITQIRCLEQHKCVRYSVFTCMNAYK